MLHNGTVSKELLFALRHANSSIFFHLDKEKDKLEGVCNISCTRKNKQDIFKSQEDEIAVFPGFPAFIDGGNTAFFNESCRFSLNYGNLAAFILVLRENDTISFTAATNSNGYLRAAHINSQELSSPQHHENYHGLYQDELRTTIRRKNKIIVQQMLLLSEICLDNTARAIRNKQCVPLA